MRIDGDRLLDGLHELRRFGAVDTGVVRPTYSDADMAARRWLRDRMAAAGLSAHIDGVGNVIGRSPNPGPALLLGSHSDTQPRGGWLDGALGVMYAIEVAQSLGDDPMTSHLAVDTVAWADEEGTYVSCLGSRSFVGDLGADELGEPNELFDESATQAIERVGLTDVERARLDHDRHIGYLEAHIEQGPYLEEAGLRIGVVTSIVGIRGFRITFTGQQNHAGTTPMHRRQDASVALFRFGAALNERLPGVAGPASVWTIGNAQVEPGAASIIPGFASLSLQFRDPEESTLDGIERVVLELVAEADGISGVRVEATPSHGAIAPTSMDAEFRHQLGRAAERVVPGSWREMPSAAGHDPMVLSHHVPCGMLFIPSIGGISHDFAEDSTHTDIVTGCEVLAEATKTLLGREHR